MIVRRAVLLALLAALQPASATAAPDARPNVVLLLVDDAAFMDLGAYGGEARTPNIDALAGARRAASRATTRRRSARRRAPCC